jgi:hypothetical protein
MDFPDDENGAVLRALQENGVDLMVERRVDFEHLFPSQDQAEAFAAALAAAGTDMFVAPPDDEDLEEDITDWNVTVSRAMVPTHAAISAAEAELDAVAQRRGGRADGWGFLVDEADEEQ